MSTKKGKGAKHTAYPRPAGRRDRDEILRLALIDLRSAIETACVILELRGDTKPIAATVRIASTQALDRAFAARAGRIEDFGPRA
jgi:hypothetical protein